MISIRDFQIDEKLDHLIIDILTKMDNVADELTEYWVFLRKEKFKITLTFGEEFGYIDIDREDGSSFLCKKYDDEFLYGDHRQIEFWNHNGVLSLREP